MIIYDILLFFTIIINISCFKLKNSLTNNLKLFAEIKLTNSQYSDLSVILISEIKPQRNDSPKSNLFLPLLGKEVFLRSLDVYKSLKDVKKIVIVMHENYRNDYIDITKSDERIEWADPGLDKNDSVYNGLQKISDDKDIVIVHDAARPLVTTDEIRRCISDARSHGAAVLGVPCKATIKETENGSFILRTIPRVRLWEVQTPQIARRGLFMRGFNKVKEENLEVTDDVSVIEALGLPVKLTLGDYSNMLVSNYHDVIRADNILKKRGVEFNDPKIS